MLACSVGFYSHIWFISVGYGLAIAVTGLTLLIGFRQSLGAFEILACLLMIVYGLRLGGYLLLREMKNGTYRKVVDSDLNRSKKMSVTSKLGLWVTCGVMYTLMTSPLYFRMANGVEANVMLVVGVIVMACGISLEAVADAQKTMAKKKNPHRFVDTGVYRLVRCPNYLGELLLWFGVLLTGTTALHGVLQWIAGITGFLLIAFVMFSGARRLELRQDKNYGSDPEYRKYVKSVPIILPFVPLYSVKKYKFLTV